ncbi:histidine phosphatase family protein [Rothia sp. P7181]|uniref:histidine phosphatase family protein n=1 Tax=Rothia sp. P7181 TaxID=3402663 RepID=UPI003AE98223
MGSLSSDFSARMVLIRHGQTAWNVERRFQGRSDIPLNDTGRGQAQEAAKNLMVYQQQIREHTPEFAWELIVTSPLSRAYETGKIIGEHLNLDISGTHEGLQERSFGAAEGLVATDYHWRDIQEQFSDVEPLSEMIQRGISALKEIVAEHPNCHIIVVAHGLWIAQIMTALTGEEHGIPENASVTELPLHILESYQG